jgi:hypothetical protein
MLPLTFRSVGLSEGVELLEDPSRDVAAGVAAPQIVVALRGSDRSFELGEDHQSRLPANAHSKPHE